jgi:phospholipid transport system substrate-binding protein
MINRRWIIIAVTGCFVALLGASSNVRRASADELAVGAESFIREMAQSAIRNLTEPDITREERKTRLQSVMDQYFHVPGIGRWVLGRHWRQASAEEREEYLELFGMLLIESYVDKFASYSGETLEIVKTDTRNEKDAIVSSTLKRPEINQVVQLEWRVRTNNGIYKIIDIMVEGISMGQTQRSEFASAIKSNDGDMGKFLEELRVRVSSQTSG